jgi:predicted nucleotidyltransferase
LGKIEGIREAYIFGSYAADKMDTASDVDIMAIGSHSVLELQRLIAALQKDIGREINVINLSAKEFDTKIKNKDPFMNGVVSKKTIRLI